ncbi:polymerase associated protein [Porcine ephemerovirus 2]|uniref:Polymerase associated protein n=1 Tax=Porcine ephemerovirus 2 TaxID=2928257 RepID=A0AAX3A6K7_9RHAB|nr:polymerase associated protein [Porcine ephemerovirus 2]UNP42118.1 polymerase associated protein [Porcine ephemerovirus 2]
MERHEIGKMIPYNLKKMQETITDEVFDDDIEVGEIEVPKSESTGFLIQNPLSLEEDTSITSEHSDWADQIEEFNKSLKEFETKRTNLICNLTNPKQANERDSNIKQGKTDRNIRRLSFSDYNNVGIWDGRLTIHTEDLDNEMFKINAILSMFGLHENQDYTLHICADNINIIKLDHNSGKSRCDWYNQIDVVKAKKETEYPTIVPATKSTKEEVQLSKRDVKLVEQSKAEACDPEILGYIKRLNEGIICEGYRGKKVKITKATINYKEEDLKHLYFDTNPRLQDFIVAIAKHNKLYNKLTKIIKWDNIS